MQTKLLCDVLLLASDSSAHYSHGCSVSNGSTPLRLKRMTFRGMDSLLCVRTQVLPCLSMSLNEISYRENFLFNYRHVNLSINKKSCTANRLSNLKDRLGNERLFSIALHNLLFLKRLMFIDIDIWQDRF